MLERAATLVLCALQDLISKESKKPSFTAFIISNIHEKHHKNVSVCGLGWRVCTRAFGLFLILTPTFTSHPATFTHAQPQTHTFRTKSTSRATYAQSRTCITIICTGPTASLRQKR